MMMEKASGDLLSLLTKNRISVVNTVTELKCPQASLFKLLLYKDNLSHIVPTSELNRWCSTLLSVVIATTQARLVTKLILIVLVLPWDHAEDRVVGSVSPLVILSHKATSLQRWSSTLMALSHPHLQGPCFQIQHSGQVPCLNTSQWGVSSQVEVWKGQTH